MGVLTVKISQNRRSYDSEFKRDAVKLVIEGGKDQWAVYCKKQIKYG